MDSANVLSEAAKSFRPGIYEHFKGGKYEVIGIALHSESLEEMVIYKALYGQGLTWVRPRSMFLETVVYNEKKVPRFSFVK